MITETVTRRFRISLDPHTKPVCLDWHAVDEQGYTYLIIYSVCSTFAKAQELFVQRLKTWSVRHD